MTPRERAVTAEPFAASVTLGQVALRVRPEDAAGRLDLPMEPNTWTASGEGRDRLWLGPDEWLVVGPEGSGSTMVAELGAALVGVHRSIIDVSANRTAFEVSGDGRHELLSHGCGLDLDPRSWRTGMCAQSLLARVPVILQERADRTRIFVRPSFAAYMATWFARDDAQTSLGEDGAIS
jgi:sarcosine oxidase subunit gamma